MEPESHPPTLRMLAVQGISTCRKCRVHGVHSPMAGHRGPGGCAFETCDCRGCKQVALLRTQRRLYQKQFSLKLKARGRAAPNCARTPPSSAHDAATAEAQLQPHTDLTLVPVLTLSDGSDDDDQVRGGGGAVGAPCIQFHVTERTPLGVNRCRLCRWHKVPPHSVGKRCPYASCKCGGPRCKARARLYETRRRWSLAKRGLQNDLDVNPTSQEGLHTPDASGTQPGGSVSVVVRTLPESPPNLLPRLSVLNIEQCAVRIQSVTVSPSVAETGAPRSDATRTYRPTSCVTVVADETSGEVVAGTSAVETTSGEKTGVEETAVTAVEETTVHETAVEETAVTAVEDNATQEPVIGVSALDEAMHKLCIECSAPLASEMELQDHVDTVHMQLLPLWRLTQLFARMREAAWPSAEGTEMTAGEASAKCV